MRAAPRLQRGTIFRAVHDETFEYWIRDEPRSKFCIVFNLATPSERDDVYYFLTTKDTARYREHPHLLTECLILPRGSYACFELDTAIEFDQLWIVPLAKLLTKRLEVKGQLSPSDVAKCEGVIRTARVLLPKHKKLLGL